MNQPKHSIDLRLLSLLPQQPIAPNLRSPARIKRSFKSTHSLQTRPAKPPTATASEIVLGRRATLVFVAAPKLASPDRCFGPFH